MSQRDIVYNKYNRYYGLITEEFQLKYARQHHIMQNQSCLYSCFHTKRDVSLQRFKPILHSKGQ